MSTEEAAVEEYPEPWAADVVVRDGQTVRIRPIKPEDARRIEEFHSRQSPEAVYFRYFSPRPTLSDKELEHLTHVDHHDRVAFVALSGDQLIAVARYERYRGTDTAEVAFFVDEEHHGRGLAALMLEYLAAAGRGRGVRRFTASTLPNNRRMLAVFKSAGYELTSRIEDGVVELGFDIVPTDASVAAVDRRELVAEAASVRPMLEPRQIAVIGVGRGDGIGRRVFTNLRANGYRGRLEGVNRNAVEGDDLLRSVDELPTEVDLVIIATPAHEVLDVVEACGARGARSVVVLSAGFAETHTASGVALQDQVRDAARRHGMRMLGPNCLGVINTEPDISMNATISPRLPRNGPLGILTEAGTLSAAIVEHAVRSDLGVSTVVAPGNRADVAASDLLRYWAEDEHTGGVLLYVSAPRLKPRYVRAARSASLRKPVAALHSSRFPGESGDWRRSRDDRRAVAMYRQTGVISVDTLQQLFHIGRVLSDQPVPAGPHIAIIGNSDGAVALAADACAREGLRPAELSVERADGSVAPHPIDLRHDATAQDLAAALAQVCAHDEVQSVLVVWAPPHFGRDVAVEEAIIEASAAAPHITFAVTMLDVLDRPRLVADPPEGDPPEGGPAETGPAGTGPADTAQGQVGAAGPVAVPVFSFPEDAAVAIGRLVSYRLWRDGVGDTAEPERDSSVPETVLDILDTARSRLAVEAGPVERLSHSEQDAVLEAYGVEVIPRLVAEDREDAVRAAERIGWPVALKASVRDRRARSAASGVVLDLPDEAALIGAWDRLEELLGDDMHPVVVQRFVEHGTDIAVTLRRDDDGSTVVEVGLGGPASIGGETSLGILPLSLADATTLVASSPVGRAITDPLDRVPVVELVHRLAEAMEDLVELRLLHLDPVVCSPASALVADAEILIGDAAEELDVRRLE